MTVRAWFTISALVLVALFASVAYRFLRPLDPPTLLASVPAARLEGDFRAACWPQRGGQLKCTSNDQPASTLGPRIEPDGVMRLVAAFPTPPTGGKIAIVDSAGKKVLSRTGWTDKLDYELASGRYKLQAEARYTKDAFVRYSFAFSVR